MFFKLLFIIIEALLFIFAMFKFNNKFLLFSTLALALVFTMLFWGKENGRIYLPKLIILFDVVADIFITLGVGIEGFGEYKTRVIGMGAFIVAQLFTSLYVVAGESKKLKLYKFITSLALFIALFIVLVILRYNDLKLLYVEALIYFSLLITSLVFSFVTFRKNPLLPLSLLCLTICDLIIGLGFIENMFDLSDKAFFIFLNHFNINLPWFFYIPSFTILALTIRTHYKYVKKEKDDKEDNDKSINDDTKSKEES